MNCIKFLFLCNVVFLSDWELEVKMVRKVAGFIRAICIKH